jgi:hypothetical protein
MPKLYRIIPTIRVYLRRVDNFQESLLAIFFRHHQDRVSVNEMQNDIV